MRSTDFIKIAPSILSADFALLDSEIKSVASADLLHVDVMDGLFVPNITIGIPVVKSIRKHTDMTLDVHLMIDRPIRYVEDFAKAGADILTIHAESDTFENTFAALARIKDLGMMAGLAFRPHTDMLQYTMLYQVLDYMVIMGVEPGFGGQAFMEDTPARIRTAKSLLEITNTECEIEVDGGVNVHTASLCASAGAGILVAGSAVFGAPDRAQAIADIRNLGM